VAAKTVQPQVQPLQADEQSPAVEVPKPVPPPPAPPPVATRDEGPRDAIAEERAPQATAPARNEPITITAEAPSLLVRAAPAPEPAPALPAAPAAESKVTGVQGGNAIGDFVSSARAADIAQTPHNEVFGISVDTHAFPTVKGAIERGERPSTVNVDALINYFAGPPERGAPREVNLEVEASPAPVSAGPRAFIIRTTIDTARQNVPNGASPLPVATDADLAIELDGNAVISHRRAGGGDEVSGVESTLLKNVSVTAMFEVELRANLPWRQPIATVRLRYRSVATGKERTITRIVHASDVARPWTEASRRHRLATLGAMWSETLKNAPGATDVARRAEELANQEPRDAKARELAMLATASSRLQSSGPTGSGR